MNPQIIRLTKSGYENIKKEYEELKSQRPEAVENLRKSRELGDLKENGYYKASRMKLSSIDNRIVQLSIILKNAKIVSASSDSIVSLGSKVIINNEKKQYSYEIVSKYEANPSKGKISDVSPLGKALLDKKIGDIVVINTPSGEKINFSIEKINK